MELSLSINGNNQQHKVANRFVELKSLQKDKKHQLRKMILEEYNHLLPEELWDVILELLFEKEECVGYFAFKRKDSFFNSDHYLFEGTEKGWSLAVNKMRSIVNPADAMDDIPTDTYCSGLCDIHSLETGLYVACPDEHGKKCDCRWVHRVFETTEDYLKYIDLNYWKKQNSNPLHIFTLSEDSRLLSLNFF